MKYRSPLSPILVTGAHRSGTTWVGKMLCASGEAAYLSEPLNVLHRPGVFRPRVSHWYTYINHQNQDKFFQAYQDLLNYRYHLGAEIKALRSVKDLLRMGRDLRRFLSAKVHHKRPLFKDPFAVFSIPWFTQALGAQVVVVVRHPAAFASSLKRLGWDFDFQDLLHQPFLMKDWLADYEAEMTSLLERHEDIIAQSCLLWRMIYETVAKFEKDAGQLCIIRHEDLSKDPLHQFQSLYAWLELKFSPKAQSAILASSKQSNPRELKRKNIHGTSLNSLANLDNWKRRLSSQEVERIWELTSPTVYRYYSSEEFA